jgi:L-aminopeptidase/D-esterase-like protein
MLRPGPLNLITDVDGLMVGNAEDTAARSGVTVVLPEKPASMAVDLRGGAPGVRETGALDPDCLVEEFHGLALAGGSVFGLAAADGVADWLSERGRGLNLGPRAVPVVPGAILFDLTNGGDKDWGDTPPYRQLGQNACAAAGRRFALGNAGAGLGAQAGAVKGGLGSASIMDDDGVIGALVAVNSFGSPVMPRSTRLWAAAFELDDEMGGQSSASHAAPPPAAGRTALDDLGLPLESRLAGNTTLGVIATDITLTKAQARRVAIMAQDGLARALRPAHTPYDGDVVFVLSTGARALGLPTTPGPMALAKLGTLAADCLTRAIGRAIHHAQSLGDIPAYRARSS